MRKLVFFMIIAMITISCKTNKQIIQKPSISFSFDDGNQEDILNYKSTDWNAMIVNQLKKEKRRRRRPI